MSNLSEETLEKGRLIYAFAKDPRTSEKERAIGQLQLDKFCRKYGCKEEDLNPDHNKRTIRPERVDELDLLLTILMSVNPYTKYTVDQKTLDVKCELDNEDYQEVLNKYAYFVKLYRVEKELLKTAFHSKHANYFTANSYARSKWRKSTTENDSIKTAQDDKAAASAAWQKMKQDVMYGKISEKELAKNVVDSQDHIQMMAFNAKRAERLEQILLQAEYMNKHKTIQDGKH